MAKPKRKLAPSKPLSGFQDMLPPQALAFHDAISRITGVYRRYGYMPIDAPCVYLVETLAGESGGEIDKQLYRWTQGSKEVALRFDLTVPLARYVAANENELTFPFKRYHWGKVWRGERVQKERGRYREFTQLDFDIVGTDSPTADLEAVLVIDDALRALGLERFTIRLNDRLLLNGVLEGLELGERAEDVLRAIDKLDKIGEDGVAKELRDGGLNDAQIGDILGFAKIGEEGDSDAILERIEARFGAHEKVQRGLRRLRFILGGARAVTGAERLRIDPAIARGLGYYTGPVFETVLDDLPEIGSVCSGGRYDDLASAYTTRELPGVGASVGISRLLAALEQLGQRTLRTQGAPVLILPFPGVDPSLGAKLQRELHDDGIEAELYPQGDGELAKATKPKNLFKYAAARGFRIACVLGEGELAANAVTLKDLSRHEQRDNVPRAQVLDAVHEMLSSK